MRLMASAALLMGCAAVPPDEDPVPEHGAGRCDAAPAMHLVGRERSEAVRAEALRLSGAKTLRWIAPDAVITMDLRSDRINIDLDSKGRVTGLRCF